MTYTGDVDPGGPSDVRVTETCTIRKAAVSDFENNVYLVTCHATGEQLLIDAAADPDRLLALVAEGTGRLGHLVTTHRHWDHTRALAAVHAATGCLTYAGEADGAELPVAPDVLLADGDRLAIGALDLVARHVPGHTPGSIVLALREPAGRVHLFTGDTLFPGGVGATDMFDYQDFDTLYAAVVARIFEVFPDDTWVYPGHGPDTTLGAERPELAVWAARRW